MQSQRPCADEIRQLQVLRLQQQSVKIKPASRRPNLLGEVPAKNTIGSWGGLLKGGDNLESPPAPLELYYPQKSEFSQGALLKADASISEIGRPTDTGISAFSPVERNVQSGFARTI